MLPKMGTYLNDTRVAFYSKLISFYWIITHSYTIVGTLATRGCQLVKYVT